jgi:hypothetical protein
VLQVRVGRLPVSPARVLEPPAAAEPLVRVPVDTPEGEDHA